MTLFFLMIMYSIFGYITHLLRDFITGHMRRGWADISNYSSGVAVVFPLSLFMFHHLRNDIEKCETRFSITYILSFISYGSGVIIGHWYKPVK